MTTNYKIPRIKYLNRENYKTHIIQIIKYIVYEKKIEYHKCVSFPPLVYKFSVIPVKIPAGQRIHFFRY